MYRVPAHDEYQPIIEGVAAAFARDLKRILTCEPGHCRAARPERCRCVALSQPKEA